MTPPTASPIAFTSFVLEFNSGEPFNNLETGGILGIEDFSVKLVLTRLDNVNELYVITDERPLRVVEVDSTARTITVKYGGAYSGLYDIVVANKYGNIKCDLEF